MMLNAESPLTSRSVACCQDRPEASVLVYASTLPNMSHTATALGSVNFSLPDHSAAQLSAPSTPSATDSHRCWTVQLSPSDSGASTPLSFSTLQVARNSAQVFGGVTPHSLSLAGRYHITFDRWMLTGTLQMPPLAESSLMRPAGNLVIQPWAV